MKTCSPLIRLISVRRHKRCTCTCILIVFAFLIPILILTDTTDYLFHTYQQKYRNPNTKGECSIPHHDPFDESIMDYFKPLKPITCASFPDLVYADFHGRLRYNRSAINEMSLGNISCHYSVLKRNGDYEIEFSATVSFQDFDSVPGDGLKIECYNNHGRFIYRNLIHKIDYKTTLSSQSFENETSDKLSLLVFGIDSLSKLSAFRKLPKIMEYLQQSLGAYVFKGYTKIAENSFPNLYPLLTGKLSLKQSNYQGKTADNFPLLWKKFQNDCVTMYAEDCAICSTFNLVPSGFKRSPTNHYIRPNYLAMQNTPVYINAPKAHHTIIEHWLSKITDFCYGNKKKHKIHIEYFRRFLTSYKTKRKIAFSWINALSHRDPNELDHGKEDIKEFLVWMKKKNILDNAVLIVMGDHGSNINAIRNTPIGRIEERMPLFAMVIPEHIRRKYPKMHEILSINSERLVSHFDAYETFLDILNGRFTSSTGNREAQGTSLFNVIPKNRTCEDAGIPDMYCPCYSRTTIDTKLSIVQKIGLKIVKKINFLLKNTISLCERLNLENIEYAQNVEPNFEIIIRKKSLLQMLYQSPKEVGDAQYFVQVRTHPGGALFESMALHKSDGAIEITESISRANRYGNQSYCIDQQSLKPFCFCKNS